MDNLLSANRSELRNQEIYFASPAQLNDPMEGFHQLYWKGGIKFWKKLFEHYLGCLMDYYIKLEFLKECKNIAVNPFHTPLHFDKAAAEKFSEIRHEFFSDNHITNLVESLARSNLKFYQHALVSYLTLLHRYSIAIIYISIHKTERQNTSLEFHHKQISISRSLLKEFVENNYLSSDKQTQQEKIKFKTDRNIFSKASTS